MLPVANLASHPKFAIRSTFVRRTIVEQMAANRVAALRRAPAIAQIRSGFLADVSREAALRAKPSLISTLRAARQRWHVDCFYY
jgi:hypothetical protein